MSFPAPDLDLAGIERARRDQRVDDLFSLLGVGEPLLPRGLGVFPFSDQQREAAAGFGQEAAREGARALLEGNFPPAPPGIRALPPTLTDALSIREQVEQAPPGVLLPIRRPDTGKVEQILFSGDDPIPAPFELALPRHLDILAEALRQSDRSVAASPFLRARARAVIAALPPERRGEFGDFLDALDRGRLTPDALKGWLKRLRQALGFRFEEEVSDRDVGTLG